MSTLRNRLDRYILSTNITGSTRVVFGALLNDGALAGLVMYPVAKRAPARGGAVLSGLTPPVKAES